MVRATALSNDFLHLGLGVTIRRQATVTVTSTQTRTLKRVERSSLLAQEILKKETIQDK